RGENPLDIIVAHHERERPWLLDPRPEAAEELARVIRRMMAREAGERYQTPAEVVKALQPFVAGGKGPTRNAVMPPMPAGTPMPSPSRAPLASPVGVVESSPKPPGRRARTRTKKGLPRGAVVAIAIAAGLVSVALAAWLVVTMTTPEGKVVVEV